MRHLRSNVVAYLALFVALGGTSYAAVNLPRNSVGTSQLRANAVTSAKVRNASLLAADFKRGQIPAGAQGPAGPAGERGPQGERGPIEAYSVIGPSPVPLSTSPIDVASINVPAGSYTVMVTGFVYVNSTAVGPNDQFSCLVVDGAGQFVANMPSQVTVDQTYQYTIVGAGTVAAGPLRVRCTQIAVGSGELDPPLQQIGARLVATRVGSVTKP